MTCGHSIYSFQGGITSSDIATKALEAKHAKIVGQALAGVPLWKLGDESRHPGVPFIVFPGSCSVACLFCTISSGAFVHSSLCQSPRLSDDICPQLNKSTFLGSFFDVHCKL